ncbi:DnaB-like helicase N-terminal domain-containing protein, partial [Anaerotruncus rubiinfantis]
MISPNKEAEQAVIGAIIMSPETVLPEAVLQIGLEDFQIVEYRNVYAACKALYDLNKPVDVLT